MEKSKVSIQFLLIFSQSGDVLFFLYARRLPGYTATLFEKTHPFFRKSQISYVLKSYHSSCILRQSCYNLVLKTLKAKKCQSGQSQTLSIGKSALKNSSP